MTTLACLLLVSGCSSEPELPLGDLEAYLAEGFGSTSWYDDITEISQNSGVVWVETSLYADSDAVEPAEAICAAVSSWQLSELDEFVGVSVRAADGNRLVLRGSQDESCTAEV